MRTPPFPQNSILLKLILIGFIFSLSKLSDAQTPQTITKNLARWHIGASLILVKNGTFKHIQVAEVSLYDQAIFLSDNSALSYYISEGQHDFIIDLGETARVSRFFLNNKSAAGTLQLLACDKLENLDSLSWLKLSKAIPFEKGVIPSVSFPTIETRYLHIHFNIDSAGNLGNFGATGPQ